MADILTRIANCSGKTLTFPGAPIRVTFSKLGCEWRLFGICLPGFCSSVASVLGRMCSRTQFQWKQVSLMCLPSNLFQSSGYWLLPGDKFYFFWSKPGDNWIATVGICAAHYCFYFTVRMQFACRAFPSHSGCISYPVQPI